MRLVQAFFANLKSFHMEPMSLGNLANVAVCCDVVAFYFKVFKVGFSFYSKLLRIFHFLTQFYFKVQNGRPLGVVRGILATCLSTPMLSSSEKHAQCSK